MQDKPVEGVQAKAPLPASQDKPFLTPRHYPSDPPVSLAAAPAAERPANRGRFITHVLLPLGMFFVVVAGIVWVMQNLPNAGRVTRVVPPPVPPDTSTLKFDQELVLLPPGAEQTGAAAQPIPFGQVLAVWDPKDNGYHAEYEFGSHGFYDFPFTNITALPVHVGLSYSSCGCTNVDIAILSAEQLNAFKRDKNGERLPWKAMSKDESSNFTVAPNAGGVIRVGWTVRKHLTSLTLKLRSQAEHRPADPETTLIVPVNFVQAISCSPSIKDFGSLGPRSVGRAEFLVWSATRDHFDLEVKERTANPCFIYKIEPLAPAELPEIRKVLAERGFNTRPKVGYRVTVEVHEERDGHYLEQGAFERIVPLVVDHDDNATPVGPTLKGTVRGDIVFGTPEDRGHVALKNFAMDEAREYLFTLSTAAGVKLIPDQVPAFLDVKVTAKQTANGKTSWQMRVAVKPRVLQPGPLPENCAIILRTEDKTPRRIRIPVRGNAVPG